ncbi:Uncharacterised protein [Vibrio cholerae]|nr:Uncharacterised protein [Vibrio cholerae]
MAFNRISNMTFQCLHILLLAQLALAIRTTLSTDLSCLWERANGRGR